MINTLNESLEIHDELNPKIWNQENKLKSDIRSKILEIVKEFSDYTEVPLNIVDVHILGSNASYNYTSSSDLDVHIIVNFDLIDASKEVLQAMYNSARSDFNKAYDISIKGINVELYVEDVKSNTISNGVYSVGEDKWIKFPEKVRSPTIDLEPALSFIKSQVLSALGSSSLKDIEKEINTLYLTRKNSLATSGEFGAGNLIFKEIRSEGLLDKLKEKRLELKSKELSLESINKKNKL